MDGLSSTPNRILAPPETLWVQSLCLHFYQQSGLLSSHQKCPRSSANSFLGPLYPTYQTFPNSSPKPIQKPSKPHWQVLTATTPLLWHHFSVLVFHLCGKIPEQNNLAHSREGIGEQSNSHQEGQERKRERERMHGMWAFSFFPFIPSGSSAYGMALPTSRVGPRHLAHPL
jgi:hypothetical protein